MADMMSKHAFGKKDGIEAAKQAGKLDEFDILFLDKEKPKLTQSVVLIRTEIPLSQRQELKLLLL